EHALAFLAIALCRGFDVIEHGGRGRGELLAALHHIFYDFADGFDLLGGLFVLLDDSLRRELADLAHAFTLAAGFPHPRRPGPRRVVGRLDERLLLQNHVPDLIFEPTDIEGLDRCVLYSHCTTPLMKLTHFRSWLTCSQLLHRRARAPRTWGCLSTRQFRNVS